MNLRDLEYLIAVADHGHFGRAAEACHVSQPTLSAQIRKLEDWLGVQVFERGNRTVSLTPAGAAMLQEARRAVAHARAVVEVAGAHRDPLRGPLALGIIPTLGPYLTPYMLRPLRAAAPLLEIGLVEETTDHLLQRLSDRDIDAAIIATPSESADLDEIVLFDEPFMLATAHDHPLATAPQVGVTDLMQVDMLLLSEGHCLRDQALALCTQGSQDGLSRAVRASSLETVLHLVGAGWGCTLIPALAAAEPSRLAALGVHLRSLAMADAERRIRLVFRRAFARRPALETVAAVLRQAVSAANAGCRVVGA
jgi:LysR family transcriptional regulator, hydrogen peroxide-inducible genes activator